MKQWFLLLIIQIFITKASEHNEIEVKHCSANLSIEHTMQNLIRNDNKFLITYKKCNNPDDELPESFCIDARTIYNIYHQIYQIPIDSSLILTHKKSKADILIQKQQFTIFDNTYKAICSPISQSSLMITKESTFGHCPIFKCSVNIQKLDDDAALPTISLFCNNSDKIDTIYQLDENETKIFLSLRYYANNYTDDIYGYFHNYRYRFILNSEQYKQFEQQYLKSIGIPNKELDQKISQAIEITEKKERQEIINGLICFDQELIQGYTKQEETVLCSTNKNSFYLISNKNNTIQAKKIIFQEQKRAITELLNKRKNKQLSYVLSEADKKYWTIDTYYLNVRHPENKPAKTPKAWYQTNKTKRIMRGTLFAALIFFISQLIKHGILDF